MSNGRPVDKCSSSFKVKINRLSLISLNLIIKELYNISRVNVNNPFFHKISDVIKIYLFPSLNLLFKN